MYKFQLTFIPYDAPSKDVKSSSKEFKVYEDVSMALAALGKYALIKKPSKKTRANVVELTRVLYVGGKPCTAKFLHRIHVAEKEIIKDKPKTKAKAKAEK